MIDVLEVEIVGDEDDGETRAERLAKDMPQILASGATHVLSLTEPQKASDLSGLRALIAERRADGAIIMGCSFCAHHRPPPGGPHPCPVCDTLCTREEPAS